MGLDYSQKRLVSAPLHHAGRESAHTKRLKRYAFLTGLMSTCISLVHLIITAMK
jgi:hypothetical protein